MRANVGCCHRDRGRVVRPELVAFPKEEFSSLFDLVMTQPELQGDDALPAADSQISVEVLALVVEDRL